MHWVIIDIATLLQPDSSRHPRPMAERRTDAASLAAAARLTRAGFHIVLLAGDDARAGEPTDAADLGVLQVRINEDLMPLGGRVEASLFCPHARHHDCGCRTPEPGLLKSLARRLETGLTTTPVISSRADDLAAAVAVGAPAILIADPAVADPALADDVHPNLAAWVEHLLEDTA